MDISSKKSVAGKLGVKENLQMVVINAPEDYTGILGQLPNNISIINELNGKASFIHCFAKDKKYLEDEFPILMRMLENDGALWISWPKRSAKVETDLNENIVREIGLMNALVDVKVCSVNEIWSGLKFVYRLKDRS